MSRTSLPLENTFESYFVPLMLWTVIASSSPVRCVGIMVRFNAMLM